MSELDECFSRASTPCQHDFDAFQATFKDSGKKLFHSIVLWIVVSSDCAVLEPFTKREKTDS